jgi:hypothetical protein
LKPRRKNPWVEIRALASHDPRLGNAGFRLLSIIIDWRIQAGDQIPGLESAIPWTLANRWLGWSRNTVRRALEELCGLTYLVKTETRGCPNTCHFYLNPRTAGSCAKNGPTGCTENDATKKPKNGAPHIKLETSSLRNGVKGGGPRAAAPGSADVLAELRRATE